MTNLHIGKKIKKFVEKPNLNRFLRKISEFQKNNNIYHKNNVVNVYSSYYLKT